MGCTSSTGSTPADNRTGRSFPSSKPSNAASRSRNCWPMPGTNSVSTAAEDRPSRIPNATSSGMRKPRPRSSAPDARRIRLPRAPNATVAWSISGNTSDDCITPARRQRPKRPPTSKPSRKAGTPMPALPLRAPRPGASPADLGSTRSRRLPVARPEGRLAPQRRSRPAVPVARHIPLRAKRDGSRAGLPRQCSPVRAHRLKNPLPPGQRPAGGAPEDRARNAEPRLDPVPDRQRLPTIRRKGDQPPPDEPCPSFARAGIGRIRHCGATKASCNRDEAVGPTGIRGQIASP